MSESSASFLTTEIIFKLKSKTLVLEIVFILQLMSQFTQNRIQLQKIS